MSNYEFVELRVAYPGHPVVNLISGIDEFGCLERVATVADQFFDRREGIGTHRQEQVYRLPAEVDNIWEVTERINDRKVRRWVAVYNGALHRLTYEMVVAVTRQSLIIAQAVASCRNLPIGPDYDWAECNG